MPNDIDLAMAIYYINPQASYRLSSSVPPHQIAEWYGPGLVPTEGELQAAWAIVSDPDWIDPNHPDHAWLVWKHEQLTGSPPPSHVELWEMVMAMLERM